MNWELILLLTGIMLFAYWLNYIFGGPLSDNPKDVNDRAILFSFPKWLAKRRLTPEYIKEMRSRFYEELNITSDYVTKVLLNRDSKKDIFLKGRELFTWERSFLCPICLHWWLTLFVGIILLSFDLLNARADFFLGSFTYLVNHLIIRKIS